MKYFDEYIETEDIKAETILSCLRNDLNFQVQYSGVFSRNYSNDILSVEKNENNDTVINLSRDGIFHILPEGLFFKEEHLKNIKNKPGTDFKSEHEKVKTEKKIIESFFRPLDTELFKLSFELEKKINQISEENNNVIIQSLFDRFEITFENKYINKIKPLLPFAGKIRGNLNFVNDILKIIFLSKVEIIKNGFSMVFIIHKKKLSKEEYLEMDKELLPFFDFLYEWFLPLEVECSYKIKDYEEPFTLGNSLILDYNTYLQ
jgi:hypothetical protein